MEVPPRLLEEARKRGLDLVDLISRALSLDPTERAGAHLELAEKFLDEGRALLSGDPVQASEKLYKAAEEAVKAIAVALGLGEAEEAERQGRWTATLLFSAASSIADRLGMEDVRLWWRAAWVLHVEGFHEARLSSTEVAKDLKYVEALVGLARKAVSGGAPHDVKTC